MASIRTMGTWIRTMTLVVVAAFLAAPSFNVMAGVDLPTIKKGKGDKCVDDNDYMRRHHPDLLNHHRDGTMRQGIRTTKYSLKGCVECHASEATGSVAASKEDFCAACHAYTAVKVDCWDCHATKPGKRPVHKPGSGTASPLMSTAQQGMKSGESK
jgi:hypothetical protein